MFGGLRVALPAVFRPFIVVPCRLAAFTLEWKPALNSEEERQAIYDFAKYFVEEIFDKSLKGDRARLAGTQLNLIRDTCDYLYRLEDDKERKEKKQDEPDELPEIETELA